MKLAGVAAPTSVTLGSYGNFCLVCVTLLPMDVSTALKSNWPIICTVAACAVTWGALNAEVATLKADMAETKTDVGKAQQEARKDHDVIVRMDERTKTMADDMKDVKKALKELAK